MKSKLKFCKNLISISTDHAITQLIVRIHESVVGNGFNCHTYLTHPEKEIYSQKSYRTYCPISQTKFFSTSVCKNRIPGAPTWPTQRKKITHKISCTNLLKKKYLNKKIFETLLEKP